MQQYYNPRTIHAFVTSETAGATASCQALARVPTLAILLILSGAAAAAAAVAMLCSRCMLESAVTSNTEEDMDASTSDAPSAWADCVEARKTAAARGMAQSNCWAAVISRASESSALACISLNARLRTHQVQLICVGCQSTTQYNSYRSPSFSSCASRACCACCSSPSISISRLRPAACNSKLWPAIAATSCCACATCLLACRVESVHINTDI
jgi:hypothetical protein|eukprot:COSAG01_NODE_2287_length_7989_cov_492.624968_4_plen_213_part_00